MEKVGLQERKRAPKLQPGIIVVDEDYEEGAKARTGPKSAKRKRKQSEGESSKNAVAGQEANLATGKDDRGAELDV